MVLVFIVSGYILLFNDNITMKKKLTVVIAIAVGFIIIYSLLTKSCSFSNWKSEDLVCVSVHIIYFSFFTLLFYWEELK